MFGKTWGRCVGCIALGAVGAVLYMRNKDKIKPMAAKLVAKGIRLKDKAMNCAAKAKDEVADVVAEAKHINESAPGADS